MGYKQAFCTAGILFWSCFCSAQRQDFIFPLDTSIYLSGTFGEFRGSHFHAGLDIRTFGLEGLPVRCIADGYVSRIKISPYGYGKAIYITHSNGHTSVYGHLSRFPDNLQTYIRKNQYLKRNFSVELLPGKNQFRFKKGDIIAFTGNSGGSYAPHLHFEIRDTKTGEIINPLLFNIGVKDTVAPKIIAAFFVNRNREYKFRRGEYPEEQRVDFTDDSITTCYLASGTKGLIVAARDFINEDTLNILGNYQVEVLVDGAPVYSRIFQRFNFSDARYIQMISGYKDNLPPIEYCFKEAWNDVKLCQYKNDGWINIDFESFSENLILIRVTDEAGNVARKYIQVKKEEPEYDAYEDWTYEKTAVTQVGPGISHYFIFDKAYTFTLGEKAQIDFSHGTFFDSLNVHVRVDGDGKDCQLWIFPFDIKTNEKFRITLPLPEEWKSQETKVCIYRETDNKPEYMGGIVTDGKVQTYSKHFGTFGLKLDNHAPEIELVEITKTHIYIKVTDDFSGIKIINAKTNNSWYLLEYDPKTNMLTGELDKFKSGEKLMFSLSVTDNKDNTSHFNESIKIP